MTLEVRPPQDPALGIEQKQRVAVSANEAGQMFAQIADDSLRNHQRTRISIDPGRVAERQRGTGLPGAPGLHIRAGRCMLSSHAWSHMILDETASQDP